MKEQYSNFNLSVHFVIGYSVFRVGYSIVNSPNDISSVLPLNIAPNTRNLIFRNGFVVDDIF